MKKIDPQEAIGIEEMLQTLFKLTERCRKHTSTQRQTAD